MRKYRACRSQVAVPSCVSGMRLLKRSDKDEEEKKMLMYEFLFASRPILGLRGPILGLRGPILGLRGLRGL